jgi:hypothetical protein
LLDERAGDWLGRLDGRLGGRLARLALDTAGIAVEEARGVGADDAARTRSIEGLGGGKTPWSSPWVFFLWSRQHSAHRHSMTKSPFSPRLRESRQPNCALISV